MEEIIKNDCLKELKKNSDNTIDLIYLDPPFYSQNKQTLSKKNDVKIKTFEFEDSWGSLNDYLQYMKKRLKECKRILKNTGSIFLHCDRSACHYLKILLDDIFGESNFQSEIIWTY